MSRRETPLDKAIKAIDEKIAALLLAREELVAQQHALERRPARRTVEK